MAGYHASNPHHEVDVRRGVSTLSIVCRTPLCLTGFPFPSLSHCSLFLGSTPLLPITPFDPSAVLVLPTFLSSIPFPNYRYRLLDSADEGTIDILLLDLIDAFYFTRLAGNSIF